MFFDQREFSPIARFGQQRQGDALVRVRPAPDVIVEIITARFQRPLQHRVNVFGFRAPLLEAAVERIVQMVDQVVADALRQIRMRARHFGDAVDRLFVVP